MPGRDLGDMLSFVQRLDPEFIGIQVMEDSADEILERNKAQLYRGETTDGGKLPGYSLRAYAELKHRMNPLPGYGIADHKLTGAYYNAFIATIEGDVLHIQSMDEKATKLEERAGGYDENLMGDRQKGADLSYGLGETEHNAFMVETYKPAFYEEIHRSLKLL